MTRAGMRAPRWTLMAAAAAAVVCLLSAALITASGVTAGTEGATGEVTTARSELQTGRCSGYEDIEAATGVTFVVVALFGGLLCYQVLAWLPVPYPVLLTVRSCHPAALPPTVGPRFTIARGSPAMMCTHARLPNASARW